MNLFKKIAILICSLLIANFTVVPNKGINKETLKENEIISNSLVSMSPSCKVRNISDLKNLFEHNIELFLDSDVVSKLPEDLSDEEIISVII